MASRVGGKYAKCCGQQSYDATKYFCNNYNVYPLCEGAAYNPDEKLCCHGKQQPRRGGLASKCCAYTSYDSQSSFCYNKIVHGRCRRDSYNPDTHQCCSEYLVTRFGTKSRCCGFKSYHPDKFFCYKNKTYALCADNSYNPLGSLCCAGKAIPLGKTPLYYARCCAKTVYNTQSHFCFDSVVHAKCGKRLYDPRSQSCCGVRVSHLVGGKYSRCCGSVNYNSNSYFCYKDKTVLHKCSNKTYDPIR